MLRNNLMKVSEVNITKIVFNKNLKPDFATYSPFLLPPFLGGKRKG